MIHLNLKALFTYKNQVNRQRQRRNIVFIIASLLVFITVGLVYTNAIPSKPRHSGNIIKPVARVETSNGTGTAFLVGKTHMITARHVVNDLKKGEQVNLVFVKANNITTTAELKWKSAKENRENDFALLQLMKPSDLPDDFPRLDLGTSSKVGLSDKVKLVGYPAGSFSITEGQISNTEVKGHDFFQLDVGAWPGSSGGPLIDSESQKVVGMLVAGLEDEFKGINIACKIDNAIRELENQNIEVYQ